jgi:coenzyme F420-0:L-glutamate ligase/coenzyme F420-1:gamma-L-glutamate ligase
VTGAGDASGLRLEVVPLPAVPEVEPGVDLALLVAAAAGAAGIELGSGDVVVAAQKAVSKAEGRLRSLADVSPSARALRLAQELEKDPRVVELVLAESVEVVRAGQGILITRTRQGLVCANSGVDSSNVPGDVVALLPEDPDRSARELRAGLARLLGTAPAIVISDSFGRPWRLGQVEVAIGCAGLEPLDDMRGRPDALGEELTATVLAIADEAAAAAALVRAKDGREAFVAVRGLERYVTPADGPGAAAMIRARDEDLFT